MKRLALAAVLGACSGQVGTVAVSLTTAPGSHVLDAVQTLKLTLTNPHQVTTAQRGTGGGFSLALELPATGDTGALIVDGLDASGQLVATGSSPAFPIGALDAKIVIYMAAPDTIGAAPVALAPPRSQLAAGALTFGAVVAGGSDASGAASDAIAIYNAYDHTLSGGMPLPAPRAGLALGVGAGGAVYLFGGRDATGAVTSTTWRFDTNVAPSGAYTDLGDKVGFARADQLALPLGSDKYLITGAPVAELSGLDGAMVARTEVAMLAPAGATVLASDGVTTTIFAGADGVWQFRGTTFTQLDVPAAVRTGNGVVALPGGKVGVVCGGADLVRIDAATGAADSVPGVARTGCAIAATARHLVVAGGTLGTGDVATTAELFDAATLAQVASMPLVTPRTGAVAIALPNDQILIAGGTDAAGAPIDTLELFTPSPVE